MKSSFRIKTMSVDGPHAFVTATIQEPRNFSVRDGSRLGGIRLKPELHEPADGTFLFRLEKPADANKLAIGSVVDLQE
jgi:hypothetical protein